MDRMVVTVTPDRRTGRLAGRRNPVQQLIMHDRAAKEPSLCLALSSHAIYAIPFVETFVGAYRVSQEEYGVWRSISSSNLICGFSPLHPTAAKMGVGASRQLARCLNDACGSLDDNDSLDPETTEHLLQSFKVLWESVPNDAQARVRSVTAKERRRFGVGAECEEPIKLSRTIEEQPEKWKSQPEVALRPLATRQEFSKDYVVFLHQCLVDLDRTGEVAAIQRRLLLLAMVKLRTALGDDEKAIAQYLSGTEERSVERKDVLRWCTIGARYEAIARDLGGPEALFVLPSNISINV